MRFLIQVLLTSLMSYLFQQIISPWIVVPIAAFISMLTQNRTPSAFFGGFAAISLLWMAKSTVIDVYTKSILSAKVAEFVGISSTILLILITGIIGGLLGGMGAASGQQILRMLQGGKPKKGYRI